MNASELIKKVAEAKTGAEAAPLVESYLAELAGAWAEYRDGVRRQSKNNHLSFYDAVARSENSEKIDGMLPAAPAIEILKRVSFTPLSGGRDGRG